MEHIKHVRHGESKTRLYRIWSNLKNRVLPNSVKAKYYFDRGIGLCDEWKNSFTSFRDWSINNGYDDKLTIDRIDNNLGYSPENCRWVDMKTQANNRSNNITVYADKECVPFSDVCKILGVDYNTAYGKIIRNLVANKNVERTVKDWKEPVSEELEEASKEWLIPQLDKSYANYGEVKMMELTHFDGYAMLDAIEFGAKWQEAKDQEIIETAIHHAYHNGRLEMKEQIMANTTDAMIGLPYENKDGGYTHLVDVSRPLPVGNNKIAIIFKEE